MARLIAAPSVVPAVGDPPKTIIEFVGLVNTATDAVSLAVMESPSGWSEPGQTPEFDEYTLVLEGQVVVESRDGDALVVPAGQAVHAPAGEWVRYSTPDPVGARYIALCVPAFSPDRAHRDDD
ncbi:MAG: cupin domain-containing protein [Acidimicrobiales bacterium]